MSSLLRNPLVKVTLFWGFFFLVIFLFSALSPLFSSPMNYLMGGIFISGFTLFSIVFLLKTERAPLSSIGLQFPRSSVRHFFTGTVAGMMLVGIMIWTLTLLSPIGIERVQEPDYWNAMAWSALVLLILALMEELAFRSYSLFRLSGTLGVRASIYISAVVFAFYHGPDPMHLLGPGVFGLYFGLAAIWTKSIALPLGFHFGLNWMQSLFGLKPRYSGSIWTILPTEGSQSFNPDTVGLVIHVILLAIGIILIELHVRRKK